MLKISTKGRYGLRLMLDLAIHGEQGMVPLKEISGRQQISEKYLEQIMIQLNRTVLVRSLRGSQGGYTLARSPETITVGEVLRALEGSLAPVECVGDSALSCPMSDVCVTNEVWHQIKDAVDNVVDHITLADLVTRYRAKNPT